MDALLTATVSPAGATWTGGTLAGRIDGRELSAALDGADVCSMVESLGGACSACPDGEVQCFDLDIEDLAGTAGGNFQTSPSGC